MDYQTIHGPGRSNFSSSSPRKSFLYLFLSLLPSLHLPAHSVPLPLSPPLPRCSLSPSIYPNIYTTITSLSWWIIPRSNAYSFGGSGVTRVRIIFNPMDLNRFEALRFGSTEWRFIAIVHKCGWEWWGYLKRKNNGSLWSTWCWKNCSGVNDTKNFKSSLLYTDSMQHAFGCQSFVSKWRSCMGRYVTCGSLLTQNCRSYTISFRNYICPTFPYFTPQFPLQSWYLYAK